MSKYSLKNDKMEQQKLNLLTEILLSLFMRSSKGSLQLKILVVFTTKAGPLRPGKALVVQNLQKNHKIA